MTQPVMTPLQFEALSAWIARAVHMGTSPHSELMAQVQEARNEAKRALCGLPIQKPDLDNWPVLTEAPKTLEPLSFTEAQVREAISYVLGGMTVLTPKVVEELTDDIIDNCKDQYSAGYNASHGPRKDAG